MRWTPAGRSPNLEDRRGESAGPRGIRLGPGGLSLGGLLLLVVLSVVFKTDFLSLLTTQEDAVPSGEITATAPVDDPSEEPMVQFVSFVLDDAQGIWSRILRQRGVSWEDAHLVLFRDAIDSACGFAGSATGPFYCPGDHKVYIDLGFFRELKDRFGAPGDFAQAYVLAHEIGHHVQALLGTEDAMRRSRRPAAGPHGSSVALELQADCYAGVWGHWTERAEHLDPGDIDEGLRAAAAVGDDRLQRQAGGRVNPDAFTHGSSAERARWFRTGFDSGDPDACDTFAHAD